jgi:uncharacterized FAD-dependent dehydrogenase
MQSVPTNIADLLPSRLHEGFCYFLSELSKVVPEIFKESIIYAPEVKYHGYRFPVDKSSWRAKDIPNLYVIGDATGYMDSFVAAAVSGIQAGRDIVKNIKR